MTHLTEKEQLHSHRTFSRLWAFSLSGTMLGGMCLVGCEPSVSPLQEAVVRDSAGIRIVENYSLPLNQEFGWHVDSEPLVRIGQESAPASHLLSRTLGAARLDDGRIAVLEGPSLQLRYYNEGGELLNTVGGSGQGPGEFGQAVNQLLRVPGDTLLVVRIPSRQISRFDGNGNYIDQLPVDRTSAIPFIGPYRIGDLTYVLPDRGLLGQARVGDPTSANLPGGFVIVPPSGDGVLLEPFPAEMYGYGFLGRRSLYAAGGDSPILALGNNDRYEISIFSTSGNLKARVRNLRPNDPVLQEDLDRYARRLEETAPSAEVAEEWLRSHNSTEYPATYPAFDAIFVDRTSHLWVRHSFPEVYDEDSPIPWEVYNAEGRYLATVHLPGMVSTLYDVGEDFVLARVVANQYGSEEVRLYRLERD